MRVFPQSSAAGGVAVPDCLDGGFGVGIDACDSAEYAERAIGSMALFSYRLRAISGDF